MKNLRSASENIKALANTFKGLLDFADELDKVEGLEEMKRVLQSEVDVIVKNLDSKKDEIVDLNEDLEKLKADKVSLVSESNDEVIGILDDAKSKAKKIIDSALIKEVDIIKSYEQIQKDSNLKLKEFNSKLADLQLKVVQETERLEKIQKQIRKLKDI